MKKLFTTLALAALTVCGMSAQDDLYICYGNSTYTQAFNGKYAPTAGDDDAQFTYEEGVYSLDITYSPTQEYPYFKLYTKSEAGEITYVGPASAASSINLASGPDIQQLEGGSAMKITGLKNDVTSATLNLTVTPAEGGSESESEITSFGTLVISQVSGLDVKPEAVYLWGSVEGGANTYLMATLLPVSEGSDDYTVTFDMPVADFDPSAGGGVDGGLEHYGTSFSLNTSKESFRKGTLWLAPLSLDPESETEDPSLYTFSLATGETFETTLIASLTRTTNLFCLRPGNMTINFNIETGAFSAKMNEAQSSIILNVSGTLAENMSISRLMTITDNLTNSPFSMQVNPKIFFYTGNFNLTITPEFGYEIDVTCANDAVEISDEDGAYTIVGNADADNAVIIISVSEKEGVSPKTVIFDFQKSQDMEVAAYTCIEPSVVALEGGEVINEFNLTSNTYQYTFVPDVEFTFAPVQEETVKYYITRISTSDDSGITITEPADQFGEWTIVITDEVTDSSLIVIRLDAEYEETDAINSINATAVNAPVYNLQGVKVADSLNGVAKGIYIVGGKKVVVK